MLIPLLYEFCNNGLNEGMDPLHFLDSFSDTHTKIKSEEQKIDFMFRVIKYVERQVVLYDSVEDTAFQKMKHLENSGICFLQNSNFQKRWFY